MIDSPKATSDQYYSEYKEHAKRLEQAQEGVSIEDREVMDKAALKISTLIFHSMVTNRLDIEKYQAAEEQLNQFGEHRARAHIQYGVRLGQIIFMYKHHYIDVWHQDAIAIDDARSNGVSPKL